MRKQRGRPRIIKQPKEPQKRGRKPKPTSGPLEWRPSGKPRIYREGTIERPKDVDYFNKTYCTNAFKPKRDALRSTPLEDEPGHRGMQRDTIILIYLKNGNVS